MQHARKAAHLCELSNLTPGVRDALRLLLEAYDYSAELKRSLWDFAVEIDALRVAGLTANGCRWLIAKQYAQHADEITRAGEDTRTFRPLGTMSLTRRTCFVLTPKGTAVARKAASAQNDQGNRSLANAPGDHRPVTAVTPEWDQERRDLRLGSVVVKRFRVPAANQQIILSVFQEEGWPPQVDDPLSGVAEHDPKQRLHDTIKALNHHQDHCLMQFFGVGAGRMVGWKLTRRRRLCRVS